VNQASNPTSAMLKAISLGSAVLDAPIHVSEIMTHDAMTMLPDQSFAEVVGMMANRSFHHVLVVDADERLHGVISDRDVLRALSRTPDWSKKIVSEIMTAEPLTASPEMAISVAIKSMLAKRINCLPVVGADGKVCGILTSTDLLKTYEKVQELVESVAVKSAS
jgi:acetoin utilization protein AcuB